MNFYHIKAIDTLPDEVWNNFEKQETLYENSSFQLLPDTPLTIFLPETARFQEADFYHIHNLLPLFSIRTYQKVRFLLEKRAESYYILNRVNLCYEGRKYQYVMVLPAGISCMNLQQKISEKKVGYLDLFRNAEQDRDGLFCTETFYEILRKHQPFGMEFTQV